MKRLLILLISLVGLMACQNSKEEVVLGELINQDNKLVVAGFISPQDSLLAVKVTRSRPINDTYTGANGAVTNATVKMSDGLRSVVLTYNGKLQVYQANAKSLPIIAGTTYTLLVQMPDGQYVESSTTVPQAVKLQQIKLDSLTDFDGNKQYFVRYRWKNLSKNSYFYQTSGVFSCIRSCSSCSSNTSEQQKPENSSVKFAGESSTSSLLKSEAAKEQTIESERGMLTGSVQTNKFTSFKSAFKLAKITAVLLNVDEAYYRYHKAVEMMVTNDSNPFAEPIVIPTNVKGGLGCFAAYNSSTLTVDLRTVR